MLDPVLSPSTELAGFRMVIVFTTPRNFVRSHASSITSPFFFIFILYLVFPRLFRSSSLFAHFKLQSFPYHILIFFSQNMTVPPHTTSFSHLLALSTDSFMPKMCINSSLFLRSIIASHLMLPAVPECLRQSQN